MAMENNRTWVEKGSYSVPTGEKQPFISRKVKGFLFLLCYFLLTELALNFYLTRYFYEGGLTISPLWGWRNFIALTCYYGVTTPSLMMISAALAVTFFISAILFRVLFFDKVDSNKDKLAILHGSSHWATKEEITKAGILASAKKGGKVGITLGGWKDEKGNIHYLRHTGPEHVLVVAPTRSGKGIGVVIPTLLSYEGAVLVLDIKGENWLLSAGWRQKNIGPCLRFEPTCDADDCCKYNPLREIAIGTPYETKDVQNVATMICDPDGKGGDDHWVRSAITLLTGAITHECYLAKIENREPSMVKVRATIADGDIEGSLVQWRDTRHTQDSKGNPITHPIVESVALEMMQKADKERSSIYSTAIARLNLWLDPIIVKNTSESSFRVNDLVDNEKPTSLYIVIPPSDLIRLRPLLRLIITQVLLGLTDRMVADNEHGGVKSTHKHQLVMLLDEASRLAKLDTLVEGFTYMASYGLKACLIYQSYKQPDEIYGKSQTLTGNFHVHVVYAPNEDEDAKLISEKCGRTTVTVGSSNISGKRFAIGPFGKSSESISFSQQSRELMTPDEVKRLPTAEKDESGRVIAPGAVLIFCAGTPPIYGVQTPFFFDPIINARSKMAPPTNSAVIHPTQENACGDLISGGTEEKQQNDLITAVEQAVKADDKLQIQTNAPDAPAAVEEEILSDAAGLLSYADEKECTQAPEETDTPSPDAPEFPSRDDQTAHEAIQAEEGHSEAEQTNELSGMGNIAPDELPSILDLLYPLDAPSAHDDTNDDAQKK